jgi:hypothetical protein
MEHGRIPMNKLEKILSLLWTDEVRQAATAQVDVMIEGMRPLGNMMLIGHREFDEALSKIRDKSVGNLHELMTRAAQSMLDVFTDEEIDYILAFYASPLGKAVMAKLPALQMVTAKVGMEWGERIQHELEAAEKLLN